MIDPAVGALLAGAYALLFLGAALQKLRAPAQFAAVFRAYRVLPEAAAALAWLLPLLELTVGVGLLASAARPGACAAGAALLLAYATAIAINLVRGRRDLACGCGGPDERRTIAAWMVWRNLALAAVLAALLLPWSARALAGVDALTIGAGTVVTALLYMSLERLLDRVAPRAALLQGRQ
jgi:Methylamine utilisation protein MauE